MKNTAPSVLELFFNWRELPENPFLALVDNSLQRWCVMTRSVDIEGHFSNISAVSYSIEGIFAKIHTSLSAAND